jgi:hypothetical protein
MSSMRIEQAAAIAAAAGGALYLVSHLRCNHLQHSHIANCLLVSYKAGVEEAAAITHTQFKQDQVQKVYIFLGSSP